MIELIGLDEKEIHNEYVKKENWKFENLVSDKDLFMKILVISMLKKINEFIDEKQVHNLRTYLWEMLLCLNNVNELYKIKWTKSKVNVIRRSLYIEILLRCFHNAKKEDEVPNPPQKIQIKKMTKKIRGILEIMLKNNKVGNAIYTIDIVGKRKNVDKKQEIYRALGNLKNIKEYYLCDIGFLNNGNYAGYATFGGNILINKNCLKGSTRVKNVILAMVILHECGHFKRRMLRDNGDLLKSTPKVKINGESGTFLEQAISTKLPAVLSYIIKNAEKVDSKKDIEALCSGLLDSKKWEANEIDDLVENFYIEHTNGMQLKSKERKAIKMAHMGDDFEKLEECDDTEIPYNYWCKSSQQGLHKMGSKFLARQKEFCVQPGIKKKKFDEGE